MQLLANHTVFFTETTVFFSGAPVSVSETPVFFSETSVAVLFTGTFRRRAFQPAAVFLGTWR
jgi:hypothetical protein